MANQPYYNPMNGPSYMAPVHSYAQPVYQMPMSMAPQAAATPYMIQVDGEMAAKAWQMPANIAPGTVIPIWDVDGVHVYFKSVDGYGRLNPTRKARIVIEDENQNLTEGQNGSSGNAGSQYITRADFDAFRNEMKQMLSGNRQNGSNYRQNNQGPQKGGNESV